MYDVLVDPTRPQLRSSTWVDSPVNDVVLSGALAHVATGDGLVTLDMSTLEFAPVAYTLHVPLGAVAVGANDGFAFVSNGSNLLVAPAHPLVRPPAASVEGQAYAVVTAGPLAYVAGTSTFTIVDVSTPQEPSVRAQIRMFATWEVLAVDAQVAYLSARNGGLAIVDVVDPDNPVLRTQLGQEFHGSAIDAVGSTLYLAQSNRVIVADVDPTSEPAVLGRWTGPSYIQDLCARESFVYAVGGTSLWKIDVSDATMPRTAEMLSFAFSDTYGIALDGQFAYVTLGGGGLAVVRLSPSLQVVGRLQTANIAEDIGVRDGMAYVGADNEMMIIDVRDPTRPHFIGQAEGSRIEDIAATSDAVVLVGQDIRVFAEQCDVRTPVAISELAATRSHAGVTLHAELGDRIEELDVLRAPAAGSSAPETIHRMRPAPAGAFAFVDREPPGDATRYALRWARHGESGQSPWIEVSGAPAARLSVSVESANPTRGPVSIRYHVPRSEPAAIDVFAVNGRRVRALATVTAAGTYRAVWDGTDERGRPSAAGVYILRLRSAGDEAAARVVRLGGR
jgi:hypothetical protein